MTSIGYFLLAFGVLAVVCAVTIGLVCWWPVTDDRDSVAALLRRFQAEQQSRMRTSPRRPSRKGAPRR